MASFEVTLYGQFWVTPEVHKIFASRPLDLHDAKTVAIRQRANLDWHYIESQLGPLSE